MGSVATASDDTAGRSFTPAADLVARCVAGEADAWRDLHRCYHGVVGDFLRRLGVAPAEIDDARQDVFVEVFRYLGRFEGRADVKTWLYRLCVTQARRARNRRRVGAALRWLVAWTHEADRDAAPAPGADSEARRRVQAALDRMKSHHREVFVLFEIEGLSGDQIARVAGCPVATVWTRLHYARREFKTLISPRPEANDS